MNVILEASSLSDDLCGYRVTSESHPLAGLTSRRYDYLALSLATMLAAAFLTQII